MQKQKINPLFLTLHNDYDYVFGGLFQGEMLLASIQEHKIKASKNLMLRLDELLQTHNLSFQNLDFIGVNQGPGPFTTLRVLITTVNGLNFACNTPCIGVDGLTTFLNEQSAPGYVVALLNAFNSDVYFGIQSPDGTQVTGWDYSATFLQTLHTKIGQEPITFIGNAVTLHKTLLNTLFPHATINEPVPGTPSLAAIAHQALVQWQEKKYADGPLLPLYLKTIEYKKSM